MVQEGCLSFNHHMYVPTTGRERAKKGGTLPLKFVHKLLIKSCCKHFVFWVGLGLELRL
jgi:hypothetical protein